MLMTKEQKEIIIAGVRKCIDRANEYYKPSVPFRMPIVAFDLRGTTAANADSRSWKVNFNVILSIENWQDTVANTVPHEVAHLIDLGYLQKDNGPRRVIFTRSGRMRREKRSVHGESWKSVMRVFGIRESEILRCHNYDVTNARVKTINRYEYKCACTKPCVAGPKHHKRIMMGISRPYCKTCKVVLTRDNFMGKKDTSTPKPVAPVKQPFIGQASPATPVPPKPVRAGTKLDYAIQVLGTHANLSKEAFITMMIRDQGMSKAGAQTYYYSALKALKSECKAA